MLSLSAELRVQTMSVLQHLGVQNPMSSIISDSPQMTRLSQTTDMANVGPRMGAHGQTRRYVSSPDTEASAFWVFLSEGEPSSFRPPCPETSPRAHGLCRRWLEPCTGTQAHAPSAWTRHKRFPLLHAASEGEGGRERSVVGRKDPRQGRRRQEGLGFAALTFHGRPSAGRQLGGQQRERVGGKKHPCGAASP